MAKYSRLAGRSWSAWEGGTIEGKEFQIVSGPLVRRAQGQNFALASTTQRRLTGSSRSVSLRLTVPW